MRDADAQKQETISDRRKQIKKSASANQEIVGMRMPKIERPAPAEENRSRKVHPQES